MKIRWGIRELVALVLISLAFLAGPVHSIVSSMPRADSTKTCSAACGTATQPPLSIRQDSEVQDDVPVPPPQNWALTFAIATYTTLIVGVCFYCAAHRHKLYLFLSQLRF